MSDLEDDWDALIAPEQRRRINSVLATMAKRMGVYLEGSIPAKKLANARETMKLPPDERVLGLIDCTVFGSAKNGIAFGERRLYYHNSWTVSDVQHRGAGSLAYSQLARLPLTKAFGEVRFPGGSIEVSGSDFSPKRMIEALQQLQRTILYGVREPADGEMHIPPHHVSRDVFEPTNDVWPNGISTNADASVITPPLEELWEARLDTYTQARPVVVRDFVVVPVWHRAEPYAHALVGLELTTGRQFWRRELPAELATDPALAADTRRVYLGSSRGWLAFDIETGEPSPIEVATLDRRLRHQLVLASEHEHLGEVTLFASELVPPDPALHLIAASKTHQVYAPRADNREPPAVTIVSARGTWQVALEHPAHPPELPAWALTDRYLLIGQRDRWWYVIDLAADPPTIVERHSLMWAVEHLSIGSDHVIVASGSRVWCYRSARP